MRCTEYFSVWRVIAAGLRRVGVLAHRDARADDTRGGRVRPPHDRQPIWRLTGLANILATICCLLLSGAAARAQEAAPATAPARPQTVETQAGGFDSKYDWRKKIDALIAQYDKDPIGRIAGEMGSAADLLTKLSTNTPTQSVQHDIVFDLDEFIAMLEKRKKNRKSGSGANPDEPLPDSILAKGPGGQGDLRDPNASARLWGQLPPKQREQILQSQNEGFPSGYEAVLSSYYKRLAQENVESPGGQASPSAAPATRPAH